MIPIEAVVDLLMTNCSEDNCGLMCRYWVILSEERTIEALSLGELRTKVRTYLQSLVPAPKLLSECEEFKPQLVPMAVYRCGNGAYDQRLNQYLDLASLFQVIPPDEAGGRAGSTGDFVWRELLADDVQ